MKIFSKMNKFYIGDPFFALSDENYKKWDKDSENCIFKSKSDNGENYIASFCQIENGSGVYSSYTFEYGKRLNDKNNKYLTTNNAFNSINDVENKNIFNILTDEDGYISIIPFELVDKILDNNYLIINAGEAELEKLNDKIVIKFYDKNHKNNFIDLLMITEIYTDSTVCDDQNDEFEDSLNEEFLEYYDLADNEEY